MDSDNNPSLRETTSLSPTILSAIPQKRITEDDHTPAVSSPLNPDLKTTKSLNESAHAQRAPRVKRESLKKREAKSNLNGENNTRVTLDRSSNKSKKKKPITEIGPLRYKLATVPTYADFKPSQAPGFIPVERKINVEGREIQFNETSDHVFNKKSFNYTSAVPDPIFRHSLLFRQTETPPFTARFSFEDRASNILMDVEGRHITTEKGWRSAKANVCMREGRWYWECRVNCGTPRLETDNSTGTSGPHVRIGIGRREATLDGPVGFDCYSYGIRDINGQKVHMSRPKAFFEKGESIKQGDVVGFEVNLPSKSLHYKVVNGTYNPKVDNEDLGNTSIERADIIRDRAAIKIKDYWVFEQAAYAPGKELEDWCSPAPTAFQHDIKPCPTHPLVPLRTLPFSSIKVYKNGIFMGTAFENLFAFLPPASKPAVVKDMFFREGLDDATLGYYPMVSVFQGGAAEVNFGPYYWFPPPGFEQSDDVEILDSDQPLEKMKMNKITPLTERYDEQIIEDVIADLVDEVYFWMLDGGVTEDDDKSQMPYTSIQLPNVNSSARMSSGTGEE